MTDKPTLQELLDSKGLCMPVGGIPRKPNAARNARTRGKRWELEVAKALGTKRTGPTGFNDADVVHEHLGIECKSYKKLALRQADIEQCKRNAKGRVPILAIKEFGTGERWVLMPFDYFVSKETEEN